MSNRLTSLQNQLLTETVLSEWFAPMQKALDRLRYSRERHSTLSVDFFILLGALRQLQGIKILRELIQSLFDLDIDTERVPLARSTWSNALTNPGRRDILRAATQEMVASARNELPDRFADYSELEAVRILLFLTHRISYRAYKLNLYCKTDLTYAKSAVLALIKLYLSATASRELDEYQ